MAVFVIIVVCGVYYLIQKNKLSASEKNLINALVEINCSISEINTKPDLGEEEKMSLLKKTLDENNSIAQKYGFSSVDNVGGLNWQLGKIHSENKDKFDEILKAIEDKTEAKCSKKGIY